MMLALCSTAASPGVSTLALLLAAASSQRAVVVEADPDGGCLGARLDLPDEPGLVTLAAAARRGVHSQLVDEHSQSLTTTAGVVVGPASPHAARSVLSTSAEVIGAALQSATSTRVVLDCGRLSPESAAWPLASISDLIVIVTRPRLDEARRLPSRVAELRTADARVGLVVVGERPYSPTEVADVAGVELLGVIADDGRTAALVNGTPGSDRVRRRSGLWRSVVAFGETLDRRLVDVEPVFVPPTDVPFEAKVGNGRR
jgi:hypothetical protein